MRAARHWAVRHAAGLKRVYHGSLALASPLFPVLCRMGGGWLERVLRPIERSAKEWMFDCQMCGQCVLSTTGMACPTNCAKQMRNGPCGGVRGNGHCEVIPAMRCVWVEATEGQKRIAGSAGLDLLPPIDRRREGHSSWVRVIHGGVQTELVPPMPPPPAERVVHSFEQACRNRMAGVGPAVVTVELAPPDSVDPGELIRRAERFRGLVDAMNITDGAGGNCHMSSLAANLILAREGFTTVLQMACRDRNRIAMQGDLLGAAALGVQNVLCLTGDDVGQGDHPGAKRVFDLDSTSLLRIATDMRDKGEYASGRKIVVPPQYFLGASANPFVPPFLDRVANLEKKIRAGAQFIQTQFCFDLPMFEGFMAEVRARGLHRQVPIIVGVGTLSSAKGLRFMAANVPGVHIPAAVLARIEAAADQKEEGLAVLVETMQALVEIEGVAGVHLMGHRNEALLARAIDRSGLRQSSASVVAQTIKPQ